MALGLSFMLPTVVVGVVLFLSSTASSAADEDTFCSQIVPGVTNMVMGVDLTKLSIFPLSEDGNHGMVGKVIHLTCNQGNKWHHPSLDKEYDWPDQVKEIVPRPSGQVSQSFTLDSDTHQLKHDWSVKVGMEANSPFGSFSASTSYKHSQEKMVSSNRSASEMSAVVSSVQVDLIGSERLAPALDPDFKAALDKLARESGPFASDPEPYNRLITDYGTHYWKRANLGGYLQVNAYITNQYVSETEEQEVEANMKVSVMSYFGLSVEGSDGRKEVTEQFRQNSQVEARYYGGDKVPSGPSSRQSLVKSNHLRQLRPKANPAIRLLSDDNSNFMNDWLPTVNANPWLVGGALVPLTDLIVSNQTLKGEIELATRWYLMTAYLEELRNAYQYADFKLGSQEEYQQVVQWVDERKVDKLDEILAKIEQLYFIINVFTNKEAQLLPLLADLNWLRTAIKYKYTAADQCSGTHSSGPSLMDQWQAHLDAVSHLAGTSKPWGDDLDPLKVNTTLNAARAFLDTHRDQPVDLCPSGSGRTECQKCSIATGIFSACGINCLINPSYLLSYLAYLKPALVSMLHQYCGSVNSDGSLATYCDPIAQAYNN